MNKATIYRSLAILVHAGIIYRTDFHDGSSYFELQNGENHHHHLVCLKCGSKEAFNFCPEIPITKIKEENGFHVRNHMFEIFGMCKKCISL